MEQKVIKLASELIYHKILEIVIVIILVGCSFPIWMNYERRMSSANIIALQDIKLNFTEEKSADDDHLMVENPYFVNKRYKIYLVTEKDISKKSTIMINDVKYKLSDFVVDKKDNNLIYELVSKNITIESNYYKIKTNLSDYYYKMEEENLF